MTSSTETTVEPPAGDVPQGVGRLASVSLDCSDPSALADFYGALLGMRRVFESPDGGVVALSDGRLAVTMMRTADHVPPTWPDPGQQLHLDVSVTHLDQAVAGAVRLGATEAAHQPAPDAWRVLLDPAGHPFCLTTVTPD
jgi:catechol 2,3-dioxygenase-like lactoylglutathione lyase family enzyme